MTAEANDFAPPSRPAATEYAEPYARYIDRVPEEEILQVLDEQRVEMRTVFGSLPAERERYRYAEGKWTPRQVLGHLNDAERIFGTRCVCFARGEAQALPGFDENAYVANATYERSPVAALLTEWDHLRAANLAAFRRFDALAWQRVGKASGWAISTRSLPWVIGGHVRHHLAILHERYGIG
jgi:DinB superfamily